MTSPHSTVSGVVVELTKFLWPLRPFAPEVERVVVSKSGLGADFGACGGERSKDLVFSSKDLLLC